MANIRIMVIRINSQATVFLCLSLTALVPLVSFMRCSSFIYFQCYNTVLTIWIERYEFVKWLLDRKSYQDFESDTSKSTINSLNSIFQIVIVRLVVITPCDTHFTKFSYPQFWDSFDCIDTLNAIYCSLKLFLPHWLYEMMLID